MNGAEHHIVIIGGGMVGLSLALLLAASDKPWRITVLESFAVAPDGDGPHYRPSFDARSSALSHRSREIFADLGLWSTLSRYVAPIKTIDVSDRGHVGGTSMTAEEQQLSALGYVIENTWFGAVLSAAVRDCRKVELRAPAAVRAFQCRSDGIAVTLGDGEETLLADLLVVADGAHSLSRARLGIEVERRDYGHVALVANVALEQPHRGIAYERFAAPGPIALLPLPELDDVARAALIWSLSPAAAEQLCVASEQEFLEALHDQFGYRAGIIRHVGERRSYPLELVVAREQCRRHLVVVGNAAHSLHPVAGQGFNLALRDVARLARLLVASSLPPGDLAVLQDYEAQSQTDQGQTIALSDRLPRLFGSDFRPIELARNLGLMGIDTVPALRRAIARRGMGFSG